MTAAAILPGLAPVGDVRSTFFFSALDSTHCSLFVQVHLPVAELEEQHLRKLFPEYAEYAARVPWLWPRRPLRAGGQRFRWALYRANQEYNALAGFLAGVAWLAWRAWG